MQAMGSCNYYIQAKLTYWQHLYTTCTVGRQAGQHVLQNQPGVVKTSHITVLCSWNHCPVLRLLNPKRQTKLSPWVGRRWGSALRGEGQARVLSFVHCPTFFRHCVLLSRSFALPMSTQGLLLLEAGSCSLFIVWLSLNTTLMYMLP